MAPDIRPIERWKASA